MQTIIQDIKNKKIVPTKIYKCTVSNFFSIEIQTNKNEFISLYYTTEALMNKAFLVLDNEVFWYLNFNPYTNC
jgi:hypothetical protein